MKRGIGNSRNDQGSAIPDGAFSVGLEPAIVGLATADEDFFLMLKEILCHVLKFSDLAWWLCDVLEIVGSESDVRVLMWLVLSVNITKKIGPGFFISKPLIFWSG
ncbi:hypothetical protein [Desulfomicrobium macestii]|uniref:hypothetical protein n=1 Tax=Desulfomicrobium macestii TaxID=90731 RepID=UPI001789642A|nr:hypothetical protein [Desulfomicrobium macestii]